jgi:LAS superfamily LD-carboxypeptidase LdcB
MKKILDYLKSKTEINISIFTLFFLAVIFLFLLNLNTNQKLTKKQAELDENTEKMISVIETLKLRLSSTTKEKDLLSDILTITKARNSEFENQINTLSQTVGVLDKLSKTDQELLQKYSKVYFLNEHYVPSNLSNIEKEFIYQSKENLMIHSKVKPFLESMILKARSENIDLFVLSSYRSFDDQAVLKKGYTVTYGKGTANQFSADQGYSEHQLGTTIDFTTNSLKGNLVGFDKTSSYKWLQENAHLFGFTLSYPKGNEYYIFEPWHFRFVGVELATKLKNENKYFYDLDQREISQYLVKIFD